MGAIDKLQQRPTFGSALVQQAMQEARTDPKAQAQLQQLVDQRPADFEDPSQVDHCHQLLTELSKDTFQIVPNRQTGALGKPEVLEARITKVKDERRRVDITPPPPSPPSYRRDPLNVTGTAPAGTKVDFYNASIPGRPALGSVVADANGSFSYELTDETKFKFGDQVGVRLAGRDGQQGRPLIVPTEPFLITNTATTYFTRSGGTETDVRTDHTSSNVALDKKTDDRPPFFQQALVKPKLDVPSEVEQPYLFTIIGGDDAVEPNATLKVKIGNDTFQTKADDMGQFALKVSGVVPGQRLLIEVRDLNGNGIDIPARVPPIALPQPQLLQGMSTSSEGLRVNVLGSVPPGGALIVRNANSGVVSELVADKNGKLDGIVTGIADFDAFEVAVRDVNGHVSEEAALFVALPKNGKGASVVSATSLDTREPDLVSAMQNLSGPPVDLVVTGNKKPGGPFLPLPSLPVLPRHAVLEVLKGGGVVQSLRADHNGKLDDGMLRGVHVGDALSFRLRDAAGRLFPTEVKGFVVPDGKCGSKVSGQVPPRLRPLDATAIGSGSLTVDPEWLAPAKILVGKAVPTDFQARHEVSSQLGGALLAAPAVDFMAQHFADMKLAEGATLTVTQQGGNKQLTIDVPGVTTSSLSFGYDDITGALHGLTETDLPKMKTALSATLAIVGAAYAQGKEPGDVGYDRALGAAKTLMFMLDRFAIQNPTAAKAAQQVALDVLGTKPFLLEIAPRDVVGAGRSTAIEAPTSRALNLLNTRMLALGSLDGAAVHAPSRAAVDAAAVSAIASFDGTTLKLAGSGVVAAGDSLVVKVGDAVHSFVADKVGVISASLPVASGTVIEFAQRGPNDKAVDQRELNPITKAVVVADAILGEGNVVGLAALVQRAPAALDVVAAVFNGTAVKGLPPGGSVVIVRGDDVVGSLAVDANGGLGKIKGKAIKDGDVVDVRVLDAAGRPFASVAKGVVVGPTATSTGKAKLDVGALSLRNVIDQVGAGTLTLPRFKDTTANGTRLPHEIHADLNPFHGPSSSLQEQGGRYSTQAAFPPGLLPDLAKASGGKSLSMGNSVHLSAVQWDDGTLNMQAGYYLDNQRPEFGFTFNETTGVLGNRFSSGQKAAAVVDDLPRLTTFLQTSIAFVAVAQKLGSEPGDHLYDLAANSAKSALVVCDQLIQQHPTFRTEILAAVRAGVPLSMPFDLPPAANAPSTAQTSPTDRVPASQLAFWNSVQREDLLTRGRDRSAAPTANFDSLLPRRPTVSGGFFGKPATPAPFFGGSGSLADVPARPTTPLYLRTR